ncbi:MAG: hypothetical protein L0Z50_02685 [Verrucomicrobiales bacterium]|nr:hypothetical protein [Verrucomicrobiales bacterium]
MNVRRGLLLAVFAVLGLAYIALFTDWLRPAPIEIASQVRFSILRPRFGRPAQPPGSPKLQPGHPEQEAMKVDKLVRTNQPRRVRLQDWGLIDPSPGGVANVSFSLDDRYSLTALRVEDVPANGAAPKVVWQLAGKSQPTHALLYGRNPEGMKPVTTNAIAEPLVAGAPYRLIVESGRRRGTNYFSTAPAPVEPGE